MRIVGKNQAHYSEKNQDSGYERVKIQRQTRPLLIEDLDSGLSLPSEIRAMSARDLGSARVLVRYCTVSSRTACVESSPAGLNQECPETLQDIPMTNETEFAECLYVENDPTVCLHSELPIPRIIQTQSSWSPPRGGNRGFPPVGDEP